MPEIEPQPTTLAERTAWSALLDEEERTRYLSSDTAREISLQVWRAAPEAMRRLLAENETLRADVARLECEAIGLRVATTALREVEIARNSPPDGIHRKTFRTRLSNNTGKGHD